MRIGTTFGMIKWLVSVAWLAVFSLVLGCDNKSGDSGSAPPPEEAPLEEPGPDVGPVNNSPIPTGVSVRFADPNNPANEADLTVTEPGAPEPLATAKLKDELIFALAPGKHTLMATTNDRALSVRVEVNVIENEVTDLGTVNMLGAGAIIGKITILSEATVDLTGTRVLVKETGFEARTDAEGKFTVDGLPRGTAFSIEISREGFQPINLTEKTVPPEGNLDLGEISLSSNAGPEGLFTIVSDKTTTRDGETLPVTSRTVELAIQADAETTLMQYSTSSSFENSSWEPVADKATITLSADGLTTIYMRFQDAAGLESNVVSKKLFADESAPSITAMELLGGESHARQLTIFADLDASDGTGLGIVEAQISESSDFADAQTFTIDPKDTSPRVPVTLSQGDGDKTVYIRVKDELGKLSEATNATISLAAHGHRTQDWKIPEIVADSNIRISASHANASGTKIYVYGQIKDNPESFVENKDIVSEVMAIVYKEGVSAEPVKLADITGLVDIKVKVASGGDAVVAWFGSSQKNVVHTKSFLSGTNAWGDTQDLSKGSTVQQFTHTDLVTDSNGAFHLIAMGNLTAATGNNRIYHTNKSSGSESFGELTDIGNPDGWALQPTILVDNDGDITIGFNSQINNVGVVTVRSYAMHKPAGGSFGSAVALSPASNLWGNFPMSPVIHANANGKTIASVCERDYDLDYLDNAVWVSEFDGTNWSTSERMYMPITITDSNNKLDFETEEGTFSATIPTGTYKGMDELVAAVETAMETADSGDQYTVSIDKVRGRVEIASSDVTTLNLLWKTGTNASSTIGGVLGFDTSVDNAPARNATLQLEFADSTLSASIPGPTGNSISLTFDGTKTTKEVIDAWNAANPTNPVVKFWGEDTSVETAKTVSLSGGIGATHAKGASTTEVVLFTAEVGGTAGNSISLVFDGSKTAETVVNDWNTANATNKVKIASGDKSTVISSQTVNLTGGADTNFAYRASKNFQVKIPCKSDANLVKVDDSGKTHLVWFDRDASRGNIYYRRHDGTNWANTVTAASGLTEILKGDMILDGDDSGHVIFFSRLADEVKVYTLSFKEGNVSAPHLVDVFPYVDSIIPVHPELNPYDAPAQLPSLPAPRLYKSQGGITASWVAPTEANVATLREITLK